MNEKQAERLEEIIREIARGVVQEIVYGWGRIPSSSEVLRECFEEAPEAQIKAAVDKERERCLQIVGVRSDIRASVGLRILEQIDIEGKYGWGKPAEPEGAPPIPEKEPPPFETVEHFGSMLKVDYSAPEKEPEAPELLCECGHIRYDHRTPSGWCTACLEAGTCVAFRAAPTEKGSPTCPDCGHGLDAHAATGCNWTFCRCIRGVLAQPESGNGAPGPRGAWVARDIFPPESLCECGHKETSHYYGSYCVACGYTACQQFLPRPSAPKAEPKPVDWEQMALEKDAEAYNRTNEAKALSDELQRVKAELRAAREEAKEAKREIQVWIRKANEDRAIWGKEQAEVIRERDSLKAEVERLKETLNARESALHVALNDLQVERHRFGAASRAFAKALIPPGQRFDAEVEKTLAQSQERRDNGPEPDGE